MYFHDVLLNLLHLNNLSPLRFIRYFPQQTLQVVVLFVIKA
ncbi:hypothetical protein Mrub_2974 [Meiothermus ruber DSM 1279]|nr:hypothetical protein Mrub_2974 [Meiothermus ruber DSM 1279]